MDALRWKHRCPFSGTAVETKCMCQWQSQLTGDFRHVLGWCLEPHSPIAWCTIAV